MNRAEGGACEPRSAEFPRVIGDSGGLSSVMERVSRVAPTAATVLILGETGSGKEVIARSIHDASPRAKRPFVRVNCGAIPPDLVDSELFGHTRGSFTGAHTSRRGWFERANGGTLFLDEVGELPGAAQVRLLRVLQDGGLLPVGAEQERSVDVRVVAATHRDLAAMVQEGTFREDLWYRLAVFPILLPPLRERPEDLAELAEHFVERAARRLGVRTPPITPGDIEQLGRYRWPGNVRELASVLERAVILGQGRRLDLEVSLGSIGYGAGRPDGTEDAGGASRTADPGTPEDLRPLHRVIHDHLVRVLRATGGKVAGADGAAARLGLNPSTLRSTLRRHGLRPGDFRRGPGE
jgi:transcriptional regulator with GAF, ATPase, and Fis domain